VTTIQKYILGAVAIVLAIALGYFISLYINKPTPVEPEIIRIPGDTVRVVEKHFYAVHDTIKVEVKNDTAKTVFNSERYFDRDTIRVKTDIKYIIPDSAFNINQSIDFIKAREFVTDTIRITIPYEKLVYKDIPFYEEPLFMYVTGVITAIIIFLIGSP